MATLRVTNLRGRSANIAPDLPDGVNITGVGTAGIGTFTTSVVVGSAVTANADGVITSGVITATSFAGDGSSLTGIDATQIVTGNTSVQTVDTGSDGHVKVNTEGSERIRVDSSGRVGLGHDSPESFSSGAYNLVIAAASGSNAGITISNDSAGTDSGAIFFAHGTGASGQGRIRYHHNGDYMAFTANATEGLRIDMGGNANIAGVCTATSFSGDGSALTGIEAGITTTYQYAQSGEITINLGTGQGHELTLAAGISTITVTGGSVGASHHLIITQPSSGITTVGFSTYFLWPSGSPPNLSRSSAAGEIDMITFVVKQQTQTGTGVTQLLASSGVDYQ